MKNDKGFTAVDIGLALFVIIIFTVTITSISYSVYLSNTEAKRTAVALNYCVDIFEHIGQLDYSEVNAESGELFPDPKDAVFYEVALSKEDSYLVTGNTKHFPTSPIVVTPAEMLEILFRSE